MASSKRSRTYEHQDRDQDQDQHPGDETETEEIPPPYELIASDGGSVVQGGFIFISFFILVDGA